MERPSQLVLSTATQKYLGIAFAKSFNSKVLPTQKRKGEPWENSFPPPSQGSSSVQHLYSHLSSLSFPFFPMCYTHSFPVPSVRWQAAQKAGVMHVILFLPLPASCFSLPLLAVASFFSVLALVLHGLQFLKGVAALARATFRLQIFPVSLPWCESPMGCTSSVTECLLPWAHLEPSPQRCPLSCIFSAFHSPSPLSLLPIPKAPSSLKCLRRDATCSGCRFGG